MIRFFIATLLGFSAFAHDGPHGPEQTVAPHGGIMRDGPSLMFELVKGKENIKVYFFTHEGKPIDTQSVKIDSTKTTLTDAKKKSVAYTLAPAESSVAVNFTKGTTHRYSFNLIAQYAGKENKGHWQIEIGEE